MILYFSSTGNSKYVSEKIGKETNEKIVSITKCVDNNEFSFSGTGDEILGFVVPVYFSGLPKFVDAFFRKTNFSNFKYVFFVATYGMVSGQIGKFSNVIFKDIGLDVNAFYGVKMPDNWTPKFDMTQKDKNNECLQKAEPVIDEIINKIKGYTNGDFIKNKLPMFVAKRLYKSYDKERITETFYVEDTCVSCGLCEKLCPDNAIKMVDGKPTWIKEKCSICLGCLHRCPKFSIQFGSETKAHGQYFNPNTSAIK